MTAYCLVIGRAERGKLDAPPDEHEIALIGIVAVSAQREGRPARVVADHHRVRGVGLPLNPYAALNHALTHAVNLVRTLEQILQQLLGRKVWIVDAVDDDTIPFA